LLNEEELKILRLMSQITLNIELEILLDGCRITLEDIKILQVLQEKGSIRAAAGTLGVSYRTLWLRIRKIENTLGYYLLNRQKGGISGGRDVLTLPAQVIIERYKVLAKLVQKNIEKASLQPDLKIYGSDCPGVDALVQILEEKGEVVEYLRVGSQLGLKLLIGGYCDVAGIHMIDQDTGEYNTHVLRKYSNLDLALIRGYWREIGFIVERGNPKNVHHPEDLLRRDVVLANRNKGSGTHLLLQHLLREMSRKYGSPQQALARKIRGYETEYYSHREAALAVLNRKADVTIGPKWVAKELGLEFVPLAKEKFDFLTRKELLEKEPLKELVKTLRSPEFREKTSTMGIYTSSETGTVMNQENVGGLVT